MGIVARRSPTEEEKKLEAYSSALTLASAIHELVSKPELIDQLGARIKAAAALSEDEQTARAAAIELIEEANQKIKDIDQGQKALSLSWEDHKKAVEAAREDWAAKSQQLDRAHAQRTNELELREGRLTNRLAVVIEREKLVNVAQQELNKQQLAMVQRELEIARRQKAIEEARRALGG